MVRNYLYQNANVTVEAYGVNVSTIVDVRPLQLFYTVCCFPRSRRISSAKVLPLQRLLLSDVCSPLLHPSLVQFAGVQHLQSCQDVV